MTTTVSVLEQRLSEDIGDWLEVVVTTAIGAGVTIVSTNLQQFDGGRDDYFIDWWVYITDKANAGIQRQVSDYATSSGTLTVRGANLTDDVANKATIRLHRYNRDTMIDAMNEASAQLYPALYQNYDIMELITGNILPNSHFRDWAVSTVPNKWTLGFATAAATTTAGYFRGGNKSVKVTATGGQGGIYVDSIDHPRLLDLMGHTVSFYAWAYPNDTANDAFLQIYTRKTDGTTQQFLQSTTPCAISQWTLLRLENQVLNDDLANIRIGVHVTTNGNKVYFDNARIFGRNLFEYLLPTDLATGTVDDVFVQTSSASVYPCDDLFSQSWEKVYSAFKVQDGTDTYLSMPYLYTEGYQIRLQGKKPLSAVSAYTDTIEIEGRFLELWLAYAKYCFFKMIKSPLSSQDVDKARMEIAEAYGEYKRLLPKLSMSKPSRTMRLPEL